MSQWWARTIRGVTAPERQYNVAAALARDARATALMLRNAKLNKLVPRVKRKRRT